MSVLILLITNCVTARETETKVIVPEVSFPEFPDPTNRVWMDDDSGDVFMSLDYYVLIFEYVTKVREAERSYERIKEIYEK